MALPTGSGLTGTVADLGLGNTATPVSWQEGSGTPGWEFDFNFTDVASATSSFTYNVLDWYNEYSGFPGPHTINLDLYNYTASSWIIYQVYYNESTWTWHNIVISDTNGLIKNNVVMGRLYHVSPGNIHHTGEVAYIGLTSNPELQPIVDSASKVYSGTRTSTTLLSSIFSSTITQQILNRLSTSLIGNLLDSNSRNTNLNRNSNSLLSILSGSLTGLSGSHHFTISITSLFGNILDSSSGLRTGSWVVYIGEMLNHIIDTVIGQKYVIANGSDLSDMTVAGIIGAMFAGVMVFALMFVRRKRREDEHEEHEHTPTV